MVICLVKIGQTKKHNVVMVAEAPGPLVPRLVASCSKEPSRGYVIESGRCLGWNGQRTLSLPHLQCP